MILVTATILARVDSVDELLSLSLDQVRRSREEEGCLSHGVAQDVENPLRLVFTEAWEDQATFATHLTRPESQAFGQAVMGLAAELPELNVFEADRIGP